MRHRSLAPISIPTLCLAALLTSAASAHEGDDLDDTCIAATSAQENLAGTVAELGESVEDFCACVTRAAAEREMMTIGAAERLSNGYALLLAVAERTGLAVSEVRARLLHEDFRDNLTDEEARHAAAALDAMHTIERDVLGGYRKDGACPA